MEAHTKNFNLFCPASDKTLRKWGGASRRDRDCIAQADQYVRSNTTYVPSKRNVQNNKNGFLVYCGNLNEVWFNHSSFRKRKKNCYCANRFICYRLREIPFHSYLQESTKTILQIPVVFHLQGQANNYHAFFIFVSKFGLFPTELNKMLCGKIKICMNNWPSLSRSWLNDNIVLWHRENSLSCL